jgi:hypothetical protein
MCREKIWPLLKNSTRISYDFYLDTHILPTWGLVKLAKMRTIELQDFFNSFSPRLAPKTIRNMHGCIGLGIIELALVESLYDFDSIRLNSPPTQSSDLSDPQ